MSFESTVRIKTDQVLGQINREIERRVKIAVAETERQVKLNLRTPSRTRGRSTPGDYPHARRGFLWKSVFSGMIDGTSGFVGLPINAGVDYGVALHNGAVIRPRKAKLLAIPVSDAARKWMEDGGTARSFPIPMRLIVRPNGKVPLLVEVLTKGGQVRKKSFIIHFILTPYAILKERPFLRKTVLEMAPRINDILGRPIT